MSQIDINTDVVQAVIDKMEGSMSQLKASSDVMSDEMRSLNGFSDSEYYYKCCSLVKNYKGLSDSAVDVMEKTVSMLKLLKGYISDYSK